jgi:cytochrome oxidase Cu insertion factor (SCO1/SenC/PrrC family)
MNRKRLAVTFAASMLSFGVARLGTAASHGGATHFGRAARQDAKIAHTDLKVGDTAPDFTLLDNHWKQVHLADFRGKKNVVLAFYVLAFTEG